MDCFYKTFEEISSFTPEKVAFISLEGTQEKCFSYGDLYSIVQSKSGELKGIEKGESVLLLYNDTVEFLTSFMACQRQGLICIPMFFPNNKRHFERLYGILKSSKSKFALTSSVELEKVQKGLLSVQSDIKVIVLKGNGSPIKDRSSAVDNAFIQYTSGSTSDPKGVVVNHDNLMHNQKMLSEIFGCTEDSIILSWLPFYHDMGLIGNLLHTLYIGCTCILMKPSSVVKSPVAWLEAIEKYKVTHTGGPNFIYDRCNMLSDEQVSSLDLSSLQVVYNGSELVKAETVREFIGRFSNCGLAVDVYRTCYGLAEVTLVVSGGIPQISGDSITSGPIASELEVIFFDEDTSQVNEEQGEICVYGDSVMSGYWQLESSNFFVSHQGKKYFRTGDLGRLSDGQLFVEGRLKEMLILNGQNVFPYDLEGAISRLDEALLENGASVSEESGKVYVFAEVSRGIVRAENSVFQALRNKINKELIDTIGVESEAVVFVSLHSLPRTSSGKIRRNGMIGFWKSEELSEVGKAALIHKENTTIDTSSFEWTKEGVETYLIELIQQKLKVADAEEVRRSDLFELGLSSLKAVEIVNKINKDLEVDLSLEVVFEQKNIIKVAHYLLDMKWLSSAVSDHKEIEL